MSEWLDELVAQYEHHKRVVIFYETPEGDHWEAEITDVRYIADEDELQITIGEGG